jgi:hypothetical protein
MRPLLELPLLGGTMRLVVKPGDIFARKAGERMRFPVYFPVGHDDNRRQAQRCGIFR